MIDETIKQINDRIAAYDSLDESRKGELLLLLGELKQEVDQLSDTQTEQAESIADLVSLSAKEATRESKNTELLAVVREGLALPIREFETTHPKLADTVNGISALLANLGI